MRGEAMKRLPQAAMFEPRHSGKVDSARLARSWRRDLVWTQPAFFDQQFQADEEGIAGKR
jgi:hypothetical protein